MKISTSDARSYWVRQLGMMGHESDLRTGFSGIFSVLFMIQGFVKRVRLFMLEKVFRYVFDSVYFSGSRARKNIR